MEKPIPKVGEIWQHYKYQSGQKPGFEYEIMFIAIGVEKDNLMVVYKPLYPMPEEFSKVGAEVFVRDLEEFVQEVEVNGQKRPRFIKLR